MGISYSIQNLYQKIQEIKEKVYTDLEEYIRENKIIISKSNSSGIKRLAEEVIEQLEHLRDYTLILLECIYTIYETINESEKIC